MTATTKDLPVLPPDVWLNIIAHTMEYPTDYGWFLRMFEDMRPVSRLFKDTVEHLFKTELFPIFEIALEEKEKRFSGRVCVSLRSGLEWGHPEFSLVGVFDRLATTGEFAGRACIFRAKKIYWIGELEPLPGSNEPPSEWPSRELIDVFLQRVSDGDFQLSCAWARVSVEPLYIDRDRQEIYFDLEAMYREYFRCARREWGYGGDRAANPHYIDFDPDRLAALKRTDPPRNRGI